MKWKQLGSKCEKSEEENESLSESESSDKAKKIWRLSNKFLYLAMTGCRA